MGFLDNFKKGITKSKITDTDLRLPENDVPHSVDNIAELVYVNDGVNICATACASCWNVKLPNGYDARSEYIGKRAATGHTSILEHSNVVFLISTRNLPDLVEFLGDVRYANTLVKPSNVDIGVYYLLIGGSWRAFSDILLKVPSIADNSVTKTVVELIYRYIPSNAMLDIINAGILPLENFQNVSILTDTYKETILNDNIRVLNIDSFTGMVQYISAITSEPDVFSVADLLPFLSVTIDFKNMSRIITQQLTRHRDGITQESQRYVNYSTAMFNSPHKFNPKYDSNHYYSISFGGKDFRMPLAKLGENIVSLYGQLTDKQSNGEHALLKEDARGFLPGNTQCGHVYMTFTYYSLIKFLQLREDAHAQAEIRGYAEVIGKWFRETISKENSIFGENDIFLTLLPKMDNKNVFARTPILSKEDTIPTEENEVVENLSPEEYQRIISDSINYVDSHPEVDKDDDNE